MTKKKKNHIPWFLWPSKAIWDPLAWIIRLTSRLIVAVIGFALMIVGLILTIIVIEAPVGIPLMVFGFLLIIRGIY